MRYVALRTVIGRADPARLTLLGVALLSTAAIVLLSGLGPSLPGPKIRARLGLAETIRACERESAGVLVPAGIRAPAKRWTAEPPLPNLHDEPRAVAIGDRIYVGTGLVLTEDRLGLRSRSSLLEFDPQERSYRPLADVPVRVDHPALAAYRGDLYVIGGFSDGKPTAFLWRFDAAESRWTKLTSMKVSRGGLAGAVVGDRLYVVGGSSRFADESATPYATMEIYDFRSNRWSDGPPMPTARHHLGVAAVGGQLYAVGGRTPTDYSLNTVERYDPERRRWKRLAPLPQGVGGLAAVASGGRVVALGGGDDREGWVTPAVWALGPATESWTRLPDLSTARHGHAAAAARGKIYVFGGAPCAGFGQTTSVESLPSS